MVKFATRIPAFMYLTDFRENSPAGRHHQVGAELFKAVTGLSVADFDLLVSRGVFNSTHMNQAVFAFRRYEDASLSYTGIDSHQGLRHYGLYDTVVAVEGRRKRVVRARAATFVDAGNAALSHVHCDWKPFSKGRTPCP